MAFNEKYKLTFEGLRNQVTQLIIEQEDFAGASSTVVLKHLPIQTKLQGEGQQSLEKLIKGSSTTVSLVSEDKAVLDLTEFLIVDDREYRIKINSKTASETIYRGSYTISTLAANPLQYSFVDCSGGDYHFEAYTKPTIAEPYPCNNIRLIIYIGGVEIADYQPFANIQNTVFIASEVALHRLIENLIVADPNYTGVDTNGDNYYDQIETPGEYSNTDTVVITMESELCNGVDPTTETTLLNSAFGGGDTGDFFILYVDENGVQKDLSNVLYTGQSKQAIISEAVSDINSNAGYTAYQDPDDTDKVIVEGTLPGVSELYVLGVTISGTWGITADGLNEVSTDQLKVVWIGYVLPAISKMSYTGGPQQLDLKATDGLGDLKSEKYDFGNTVISQMEAIATILRETGLNLNIYSFADKFEDGMDANTCPFKQTYISQEAIAGRPMNEALEDILKTQGCELMQSDGAWYIIPFNAYGTKIYYRYDFYGNFTVTGTKDLNLNIGNKSEFESDDSYGVNIETTAMKTVAAAHSLFDYRHDYGLKEQLLRDPTLSLFDTDGSLLFWDGDTDYAANDDGVLTFSAQATISQIIDIAPYDFKVEFEYNGQLDFEIIVIDATGVSRWFKDGTFSTHPRKYEKTVTEMEVLEVEVDVESQGWTPEQARIDITGYAGANLKKAEINPLATGDYVKGIRKEASYDIEGYREEPREMVFVFGDLPSFIWAKQRYLNGTLLSDETLTAQWEATDKIIELVAEQYTRQLTQHRHQIIGDFIFNGFVAQKTRFYDSYDGKYYRINGGVFDYKMNVYSLELEEIKQSGAKASITKETVLYDGRPRGTSIYSTNREGFSFIGGGGSSVDLSEYLTETQIIELVRGTIDTFTGADVDSTTKKITIYHGRGIEPVDVLLFKDGKEINKSNYMMETNGSTTEAVLTVGAIPFTDSTVFTYRIR